MVTEAITPLFGLPVGPEVLVIVLIAILLFGANKIPELARSTGEAMGEFQKGREEAEQELEQMREELSGQESMSGAGTGPGAGAATDTGATDTGAPADGGAVSETETETETETTE